MNKLMIVTLMAMVTLAAGAQGRRSSTRRGAVGADGGAAVAQGKDARVLITRKASLGSACLQSAPTANGTSYLGKVFKKPRQWIVPELEYQTAANNYLRAGADRLNSLFKFLIKQSIVRYYGGEEYINQ